MCFQTSNFELNLLHVSSGNSFFKTYFMSKHKFELILLPCGFLKSYCVSMHKEYCFTWSGCVLSILYLPFSFIQWLILTDSPLSVIWWQALFCLTSCWVALLCAKSVKIILWALYLQPTLKSYSHSALSSLRTAWVGKGLEQNTLKCGDACFHYTLRTTKTLWTYFELVDMKF